MAHPPYNHFRQNTHNMPPLQTQGYASNSHVYSPPSYQQSPGALSPTGSFPPAKRQRLSPQPQSPYSPYSGPQHAGSPNAMSPPIGRHLSLPHSPAVSHPTNSFHQPQAYQHPNASDPRSQLQGSMMPPPKPPYGKAQDSELEKANPRDVDVNNISDVLTGSGIDIRAEEEAMLHTVGKGGYGAFNTQGANTSAQNSFDQWSHQSGYGAYQGTGPLSQPMTKEAQQLEFVRRHEHAARVLNESAAQPLTDPFLFASTLRQRIAKRAYENGITVNLDGLFDKIPEKPRDVARTIMPGSNGESVVETQASSLLTQNAPLVEILSLLSLAAEERVRTVVDDAFGLAQSRQNYSDGIVPPSLADIAVADGESVQKIISPINVSKTAWEAVPDSAVSPLTVTPQKQPLNAARLPTPPSEARSTPVPTIQFTTNHVTTDLKRSIQDDDKYERERIAKRQKRLQGNATTPTDAPVMAPLPPPEKMTKKERDRINKIGQSEDMLHRKANETASMAFGKKKKYSWMTGGGSASGPSTPGPSVRPSVGPGGPTTALTGPAPQQTDRALIARKRIFAGGDLEKMEVGKRVQMRDLVLVLERDGKARRTLAQIMARIKSTDKDELRGDGRKGTESRKGSISGVGVGVGVR